MKHNSKAKNQAGSANRVPRIRRFFLLLIIIIAAVVFASFFVRKSNPNTSAIKSGTYQAKKTNLTISVTESGDIRALNSKEITSKVEGMTTIISIVEEGTIITSEDVNNEKVLVELDSSNIKERLTTQEISFLSAQASLTDATESLEIQEKQNESDIEAGKLKVRFAIMDFKKYLGENVAENFLNTHSNNKFQSDEIAQLITDPNLGGTALQTLRQLQDNITLTDAKYARSVDKYEGTKELYDKKYVAQIELQGDKLEMQSLAIQQQQAKTDLLLFKNYEFPKEAERLISDHYDFLRQLDQVKASARSKTAQAQAQLASKQATFRLQKEKLEKYQDQLEGCIIKAPAPGEVVYASSTERRGRRSAPELIEVGAEIRERQRIIVIPDTSIMKVDIKIHETWIDKVDLGQEAIIRVAAFPDQVFSGKVIRTSPLADPESWMNPDLKVYSTDVAIEGIYDYLKTGMTAKVEIIIEQLNDVISVPIQSVVNYNGNRVCYILNSSSPLRREVETGSFNDSFVEIKSGVNQGDLVMLNPPRYYDTNADSNKGRGGPDSKSKAGNKNGPKNRRKDK